jgi:HEPN domain-containing protein
VYFQSAEKALKAALYAKDGNQKSQSHNLANIASVISDPCIISLACNLEHRVGPHIRMRYPDAFMFPTIPSDVFTEDDVTVSCRLASQILERVQNLL